MAIRVASSWGAEVAAGTTQAIAVSGIQTGDLLVVVTLAWSDLSNPLPLVPTDNQSNTWTSRTSSLWGGTTFFSTDVRLADCVVKGTGPTTVTVRSTAAVDIGGFVLRIDGQTVGGHDQFNGQQSGSNSNPPVPATTSVGGIRLLVQALGANESTGAAPFVAPGGYVLHQSLSAGVPAAIATKTALAAVESGPRWLAAAAGEWCLVAGTYREGGGVFDTPIYDFGRGSC